MPSNLNTNHRILYNTIYGMVYRYKLILESTHRVFGSTQLIVIFRSLGYNFAKRIFHLIDIFDKIIKIKKSNLIYMLFRFKFLPHLSIHFILSIFPILCKRCERRGTALFLIGRLPNEKKVKIKTDNFSILSNFPWTSFLEKNRSRSIIRNQPFQINLLKLLTYKKKRFESFKRKIT